MTDRGIDRGPISAPLPADVAFIALRDKLRGVVDAPTGMIIFFL